MSKRKSIFVTALLAVLLAALDVSLFYSNRLVFVILTGALALYGFSRCAVDFYGLLRVEPAEPVADLELPDVCVEPADPVEGFDFESIIDEIQKEGI